jgi:hypothetical protein
VAGIAATAGGRPPGLWGCRLLLASVSEETRCRPILRLRGGRPESVRCGGAGEGRSAPAPSSDPHRSPALHTPRSPPRQHLLRHRLPTPQLPPPSTAFLPSLQPPFSFGLPTAHTLAPRLRPLYRAESCRPSATRLSAAGTT